MNPPVFICQNQCYNPLMKKLVSYLKDYRKEVVLAPLFKMLEALFDLFVPLVVAAIIDRGIAASDYAYVGKMCLVLALLAALGLAWSATAQFFAARASVGFAARLRRALFAHIQELSCSDLDTLGTSTLITRMTSDVNQVQNGLNLALRLLLRSPFIVFGAMIMAFTIDHRIAGIFAAAIVLLSIVVFGIMLISIPLYRKVQTALDGVLGKTRENLTGVRVVRAFRKEADEVEQFRTRNDALTALQKYVGRFSALMNPVTFIIINAATVWLIYAGALRVQSGTLTQGSVVALYNYMAQILVELVKLANLIISITRALACADRISNVLESGEGLSYGTVTQSAVWQEAGAEAPDAVSFEHVSFTYAGAGDASLSDISFQAKSGETIGIIGGTGSGKSSLVSLIPRFYDATRGCVKIDGVPAQEYAAGELIRKIAVVPQKAVLFQGTIRENLLWGNPDASDEELWEALTIAQAKEVVEEKEGGLDYVIEQNGRNLSGGQRQRLTIARALVRNADILILDDSASALDYATEAALRAAIREHEKDTTVFLVSQRTGSVRHADRILVLDDGNLVGNGTHEELMKSCEVYQEIYYSQFPEERKVPGGAA